MPVKRKRRYAKSVAKHFEPPSGYAFHMLKGAAVALGSAYSSYARGKQVDAAASIIQGAGEAITSYAQEMGLDGETKRKAYEQRANQPMSQQTCAMTRLGQPMTECDECGSTMPQPSIDAIDEPSNYRTLWVYGRRDCGDNEGIIYFLCSAVCHRKRRVRAARDGYRCK